MPKRRNRSDDPRSGPLPAPETCKPRPENPSCLVISPEIVSSRLLPHRQLSIPLQELRQPEVEDLHMPVGGHHDVVGLESRCTTRFWWALAAPRQSRRRCVGLSNRKRLGGDKRVQCLPVDELHRYEDDAVGLIDFVDGGYSGMGQRCRGARLAQKPSRRSSSPIASGGRTFRLLAGGALYPRPCTPRPCRPRRGRRRCESGKGSDRSCFGPLASWSEVRGEETCQFSSRERVSVRSGIASEQANTPSHHAILVLRSPLSCGPAAHRLRHWPSSSTSLHPAMLAAV